MKNKLILHYHTKTLKASQQQIWQWQEGQSGRTATFTGRDGFGQVAELIYPSSSFLPQVYFLLKTADFSWQTEDFSVNLEFGEPATHVWLVEGDDQLYYSKQAAWASPFYQNGKAEAFDMAIKSQEFDNKWAYEGWLGARYQVQETNFRLWAPTASRVDLLIYDGISCHAPLKEILPMTRGHEISPGNPKTNTYGVWFAQVSEDLANQAYAYRLHDWDGSYRESPDPYTEVATKDGKRSVILSQQDRQVKGFKVCHGPAASWRLSNPNQAVIMEMHIRDFSKSETSGVDRSKRGKFLGACQTGTVNSAGDPTCFDYVKSLGVNYIQLQPIFDHHKTIDDKGNYAYNWGYDPENYNVPSPIFASNPDQPVSAILDLKTMIQAYHDAGIGVIMDVVYNHTYSCRTSPFQLTVPDYFYRMKLDGSFENGSGCGNETASEKAMMRQYMLDSIRYWIEEYNIDGFRFDLMGLHDVKTMQAIRQMVDEIDPRILLYGEGWDMGEGLADEQKAKKANADRLPRIGFFNDDMRNAVKGAEVYGDFKRGFVSDQDTSQDLVFALKGSRVFAPYLSPSQLLNYVEAHDNYNLNDLFWALHPDDNKTQHLQRILDANLINLLMPGMVFMQLGQEFCRTKLYPTGPNGQLTEEDKERAMNSYNSPDEVNQVDWDLVSQYKDLIDLVRQAIKEKTSNPIFSHQNFTELDQAMEVLAVEAGQIHYQLSDQAKTYQIKLKNLQKNEGISETNIQKNVIITITQNKNVN